MKVGDFVSLWHNGVITIDNTPIHIDNILTWHLDFSKLSIKLQLVSRETLVFKFPTLIVLQETWEYVVDSILESERFSD